MQLKSITTQGFKSFAKKINIDLGSDVTGVVGPNGSGKSNVVEAIKFVLGEQSMKGLRSKSGSDLIFKGSQNLSPLSRASVSIHLDNRDKNQAEAFLREDTEEGSLLKNFLNLDEIVLTREIYKDGNSEYFINDTKVRLKDVQELLALANISVAGHTIVNQGEADRILLSNNVERREMIEDALGLRIYHLRIKETEKKLDKVKTHLEEIEAVRRESLPQIKYLKKQVTELEKREDEIENLSRMLKVYLYGEDVAIQSLQKELGNKNLTQEISTLETKLESLKNEQVNYNGHSQNSELTNLEQDLESLSREYSPLQQKKDSIYRERINLELEIKFLLEKSSDTKDQSPNIIARDYRIEQDALASYESAREDLWQKIFSTEEEKRYAELKTLLSKAKGEEIEFFSQIKTSEQENAKVNVGNIPNSNLEERIQLLENNLKIKDGEFQLLTINLLELETKKKELETQILSLSTSEKENTYKLDNEILKLKLELEKLYASEGETKAKRQTLENKERDFEILLQELSPTLGTKTFRYKTFTPDIATEEEQVLLPLSSHDLARKIERSRIIIEESGVVNADEVLAEYHSLSERDTFLVNEITDLEKSQNNLSALMEELKNTLLEKFQTGLDAINQNFNSFFTEIFPGGSATLNLEKEVKNEDGEVGDEIEKKPGIQITIHLPQKKISDLQMLSGGERALSSIALIFAMSSINHPPFMILDETDAALDEANAQKYGRMIRRLAENSKLLVVTHNRETMNQCDVLYGVTVGAEGHSKLLSIKFDAATEFAK